MAQQGVKRRECGRSTPHDAKFPLGIAFGDRLMRIVGGELIENVKWKRAGRRRGEDRKKGNEAAGLAVAAAFLNLDRAIELAFGHISSVDVVGHRIELLHDLWGPLPFRPVPIDSAWLTPKVVQFARGVVFRSAAAISILWWLILIPVQACASGPGVPRTIELI